MTTIHYSSIELAQCARLIPLLQQLGYQLDSEEIRQHISEIRERGGDVFVASDGDEFIGCVSAIIDVRLAAGKNGEIVSLVVLDRYRGQGIGKALVAVAESYLANHVSTVRVRANTMRTEAHKFYTRAGYHELKSQKIFSKKLSS
jgi:GNAT superfamily N-acetyltransferase